MAVSLYHQAPTSTASASGSWPASPSRPSRDRHPSRYSAHHWDLQEQRRVLPPRHLRRRTRDPHRGRTRWL